MKANIFCNMKSVSLFCALAVVLVSSLSADVLPVDKKGPIFRIYGAFSAPNQDRTKPGPQVTFDAKHPLLVVSSVRDVRRTSDGVVLTLNDKDAKTFSGLTRKMNQGLLVVEGEGNLLTVLHITEPLNNGVLVFKDADDPTVTKYLRRRFNLGGGR